MGNDGSWGVSDGDEYGSFTLLTQRFPIASKNYLCVSCARIIEAGTRHEYDAYMDGSEFRTQRIHERCDDLFDDEEEHEDDGGIPL